jgi:hypothetical protein
LIAVAVSRELLFSVYNKQQFKLPYDAAFVFLPSPRPTAAERFCLLDMTSAAAVELPTHTKSTVLIFLFVLYFV